MYLANQCIVHFPGVDGHLDNYGIFQGQVTLDPVFEVDPIHLVRSEDLAQVTVYTDGDEEILVDVETDEARGGIERCG
jgi:hypothetical protein